MIKSSRIIKLNDELHHCSTICHRDKDYFIAFYNGQECTDDQHVVITHFSDFNSDYNILELDKKTGNPLIFEYKNKIYLIYSYFSDVDENGNKIDYGRGLVNRWKNCDNFIGEVDVINGKIVLNNVEKIDGCYGRLARCKPIYFNGEFLIPLYKEHNPLCEIWTFDGTSLSFKSSFGHVNIDTMMLMKQNSLTFNYLGNGYAIQPSLIELNGKLFAFCRNVCRINNLSDDRKSWIFNSSDAVNWSGPEYNIVNHNNSLNTIPYNNNILFLLNTNRSRSDMILCANNSVGIDLAIPIDPSKLKYSYPNYDWDGDFLNIVHSNCGAIAWHKIDIGMLNALFKK